MSESPSEKVTSPDDTTQDILKSRRGFLQVFRKLCFGKSSIGRYLFYGLPIVVFVLTVTIFVVSITTVNPVEVPFQDFRGSENQQGGQIDRDALPDFNATETTDTNDATSTHATVEVTLPTKPPPHIVLASLAESDVSETTETMTEIDARVQGSTQYVLNHQVYVREGPGREYPIAGFGLRGMSLIILELGEEWSKIRTENSLEGYMLNELFGPVRPQNVVEEIGMGRYMYINTDAANLREGPSIDTERITVAYRGEKVYQIATNGGWSRVKTEGGIIAYVRNDLISETLPVDPFVKTNRSIYVDTNVANVRKSATTNSAVIAQVRRDERLTELETNGSWSKVKLKDGTIGYVYGELLTTLEPAPSGFKKVSGTVYVNRKYVNIRSRPTTDSSILTVLRFGTSLKQIAVGTRWTFIEYSAGKRGYIRSDLILKTKPTANSGTNPTPSTPANDKNAARRKQVVEVAHSLLGTPYILGGASTRGVDCSGLVRYAYSAVGYNMFHGATGQAQLYGTKVSFSKRDFSPLLPGDLIFFSKGTGYYHVGIYVGDNHMIHATSRNGVHIVNLMKYAENPALVKRVLPVK